MCHVRYHEKPDEFIGMTVHRVIHPFIPVDDVGAGRT